MKCLIFPLLILSALCWDGIKKFNNEKIEPNDFNYTFPPIDNGLDNIFQFNLTLDYISNDPVDTTNDFGILFLYLVKRNFIVNQKVFK